MVGVLDHLWRALGAGRVTVSLALVGVSCCGALWSDRCCRSRWRLGFDPATSSAPSWPRSWDVTGLVIYFTVGIVVLHGTVL